MHSKLSSVGKCIQNWSEVENALKSEFCIETASKRNSKYKLHAILIWSRKCPQIWSRVDKCTQNRARMEIALEI